MKALYILFTILLPTACQMAQVGNVPTSNSTTATAVTNSKGKVYEVTKTEAEWRALLTPEEYHILREQGTERAFSGKYWDHHEKGIYVCRACGKELFSSDTKFDSGTGWPSFFDTLKKDSVEDVIDSSYGMVRTESRCSRCGGHLGHLFDDGPAPTNKRYCMDSASLTFIPSK